MNYLDIRNQGAGAAVFNHFQELSGEYTDNYRPSVFGQHDTGLATEFYELWDPRQISLKFDSTGSRHNVVTYGWMSFAFPGSPKIVLLDRKGLANALSQERHLPTVFDTRVELTTRWFTQSPSMRWQGDLLDIPLSLAPTADRLLQGAGQKDMTSRDLVGVILTPGCNCGHRFHVMRSLGMDSELRFLSASSYGREPQVLNYEKNSSLIPNVRLIHVNATEANPIVDSRRLRKVYLGDPSLGVTSELWFESSLGNPYGRWNIVFGGVLMSTQIEFLRTEVVDNEELFVYSFAI